MSQITTKVGIVDSLGNVIDQSVIQGYEASNKEESTTSYYGFLNTIGNWYIMRVTATDIDYARGLTDYTTSWTGRAGLTYAKFDIVF